MTRITRAMTALALTFALTAPGPMAVNGAAVAAVQERQTLNVQGADIRAFIQDVARTTGRTFIVDPSVSGTVTVSSQRPLTRAQLFEVFLSTLRANGLVVTPTASGAYRISPAQGAAQGPATVGSERFATEVFQLRNVDASSAAETVRPLVGPQGQVLANPSGNSLVVADFADNLSRIRALIGRIDVDRSSYEVVSLDNSSAREIAQVLDEVLAPPGGGAGVVSVTPVESSNSIVLRGDPSAVARVRQLIDDLDGRAQSADDIKVVFLEHANAEQLLPVLQQLVGQPATQPGGTLGLSNGEGESRSAVATPVQTTMSTTQANSGAAPLAPAPGQRASIARFGGANALVIAGPPELQRRLAEVIRQLDVRRQQVLIEGVIVELSDEAVKELGVQWLAAGESGVGLTNYSDRAAALLPIAGAVAGEELGEDDEGLQEILRNAALESLLSANGFIGGGGWRDGDNLFGFIINAAKTDEGSNLLQTPSVMTLDNEEAVLLVGQEVPITTGETLLDGNSNPFRTTQRQDIGVKLTVRPQINAGGSITLTIRQEVSSINAPLTASASDLVLNKRELENTLVVDDGDIAVAGGLLQQDEFISADRVPVLGDIPGLGVLFRSNTRSRGRTNLMIFIRPTIIRTAADAQRLAADRWGYIRDEQQRVRPQDEPSLDTMLRDYMRTQPPAYPEPTVIAPVAPVSSQPLPPAQDSGEQPGG